MRALVIVDVQNDFCEGGALAVAGGREVSWRIFDYVSKHRDDYATIVFTKDWHKPWPSTNGGHFSKKPDFVDTWPVHCVKGTHGASLDVSVKNLWRVLDANPATPAPVFYKGWGRPDYSGFQGVNEMFETLSEWLDLYDVTEIDVVGIAGDHCVRATALDGVRLGYTVNVLPDMVASVGGAEATTKMLEEVDAAQNL